MNNRIIERIVRELGAPDVIEALAERLTPTDLQSLLLAVYQRRAAAVTPRQLLERYEHDRFVRPAQISPLAVIEFDRLVWSLLADSYTAVALAPVCPLGANAAIATVHQNKVVTTIRNTEVMADVTNALALECASRRCQLLRKEPASRDRIRLYASHRVVRGQAYSVAGALAHFQLLGLCVAGRDEGSSQFETTSLVEQIDFYLRLLHAAARFGYTAHSFRVALTPLEDGEQWAQTLREQVLAPLAARYPDARCALDRERATGRGYYVGACFHIYATNETATEVELVDGGFTTWTQQLLSNHKERLLISGIGGERICSQFSLP